ncbi:uncharacterized protein TRIADDRAFT_52099 [Trichoplax adhaerens]|uniref:Protein aurora borealis n=1 Tax=Trichoplax adhaerens TaxID=10228 RepID=B3RLS0_TRIAD|nr:hypothetical protein TRIADDRAFT_52099 [Trichoplax adhaerens]EDV29574.1 hypothetical protein TRIADDRAFT_52099 [Trichoplax adhaerens]|eukprot:XP_002108776.1 hypothetical protein TRIADDRAFT_52099 [Trichoplax adhaerens]
MSSLQCSYNPFEPWCNNNRINFPDFSPSLMKKLSTPNKPKTKTFRWSIDQIAVMNPADIDEQTDQDSTVLLSKEQEEESQNAIESFFSQNLIAPSPWVNKESKNSHTKSQSSAKSPFMPVNSTALFVTPESCQNSTSQKAYKDILLSSLRKKLFLQGNATSMCQYQNSFTKSPLVGCERMSLNTSCRSESIDNSTIGPMSLGELALSSQESSYTSDCSQFSSTPARSSMIKAEMLCIDISPIPSNSPYLQGELKSRDTGHIMDASVRKLSFDDVLE